MKLAHIVFIMGDYYPLPSANGICADMLIKEMLKRGHTIEVICNGEKKNYRYAENDGVRIHTVQGSLPNNIYHKIVRKMLSYPRLVYWPINFPWIVKQTCSLFDAINEENPVDCIIVIQKPVEASFAGMQIKKKYPHIKSALYVLDSIANNLDIKQGIRKILSWKSVNAEYRFHEAYDYIFHMEFNELFYSSFLKNRALASKITYLNLPLVSKSLNEKFCSLQKNINSQTIRFVYSGMLGLNFRDPSFLIKLISNLNIGKKIVCEFYSKISLNRFGSKEYESNKDMFVSHQYIPQTELNIILANSDFLLSIGNPMSEIIKQIPSKIFIYMSTGKPIVHILGGENDICIDYLKHYKNCLLLNPNDDFDDNLERFKQFIGENQGQLVQIEDSLKAFPHNTPEWSVDMIEKKMRL